MTVRLKRAYDSVDESDGKRILVDRLWPRGVSKEKASLYKWLKELGPSHELRKWFNHDPDKFAEFKVKYRKELQRDQQKVAFAELEKIYKEADAITLIFAARNVEHNHVQVLKEMLKDYGDERSAGLMIEFYK